MYKLKFYNYLNYIYVLFFVLLIQEKHLSAPFLETHVVYRRIRNRWKYQYRKNISFRRVLKCSLYQIHIEFNCNN